MKPLQLHTFYLTERQDLNSRPLAPQKFCLSKIFGSIRDIRKIWKHYDGEFSGFSICSMLIPQYSTAIDDHFISYLEAIIPTRW